MFGPKTKSLNWFVRYSYFNDIKVEIKVNIMVLIKVLTQYGIYCIL